ncbi:MAG: manganese efflux pump [Chloroflexi bacterium]|nr:manganese efflux pump [Chloroflexota bacterium]
MDFPLIIFMAFSLSADCFAVALSSSISMRSFSYFHTLRTSFAFGLFQFLMPVLGWLAGRSIVDIISAYDHWLAFGLLAFVGGRMVWESFRSKDGSSKATDITRGVVVLTMAVATSIDALSVGLSLAFLETDILSASLVIGVVAFAVTTSGFLLGRKVGGLLGKRAKLVGGLILIGIGLRVLLSHIL